MPTEILLDTHALVWWVDESANLSKHAQRAIANADQIVVSAISFWEVGMLVAKDRLRLDRSLESWQLGVLAQPGVIELPVSADIARASSQLADFHGDPADRIIVASALMTHRHLVSRDTQIGAWASSAGLTCIW